VDVYRGYIVRRSDQAGRDPEVIHEQTLIAASEQLALANLVLAAQEKLPGRLDGHTAFVEHVFEI
jgi:hypothetical protein